MTRLPRVSGRRIVRALRSLGYEIDRQRGSHIILRHRDPPFRRLVVPDHKEVSTGTLRAVIRHAGLNPDEFRGLLR